MDSEYVTFQRTDRQFRDRASDLLRSDMHDFSQKLDVFVHFIRTNPTLAPIVGPYLGREVGLDEWLQREGGHRGLGRRAGVDLPLDDDDRLALILQMLQAVSDDKVDVLNVAFAVSNETKYDDLIRSFNDKFTRLAVRDLGEKLRELAPSPPSQAATVIHTGAGSTSTIAIGSNIAQTVGVSSNELSQLLVAMREVVEKDTKLGTQEKIEMVDDIDLLEREGRRTVPRAEIVMMVLQSLAAVPGLVDLAQTAANLFHVAL